MESAALNIQYALNMQYAGSRHITLANTPDLKNSFLGKDPNAGKALRWGEKGTTEDKMVGCHHQLNGHEFEHAPGGGD